MNQCLLCKHSILSVGYCQYCDPIDLCIVGGGISGLYITHKYISDNSVNKHERIILLEQNKTLGGRIKTQYNSTHKKKVMFERGPWRIHEKHKKTIRLCKEFNIHLRELSSSSKHAKKIVIRKRDTSSSQPFRYYNYLYNSFFSQWDFLSLFYSPQKANQEAQLSGYGDTLYNQMIHGNAYRVIDDKNYDSRFYYAKKGFSELIRRLEKRISYYKKNIIKTSHKVTDVMYDEKSKRYTLHIAKRNKNHFSKYVLQSKKLCIAIPPRFTHKWSIYKHLRLSFSLLDTSPLLHIYAKVEPLFLQKYIGTTSFHIKHDGISSQLISSNYDNHLVQVCYTGGKNAITLHRLNLHKPELLYERIICDLSKLLGIDKEIIKQNVSQKLHVCYYPHAVHYWKPQYHNNKHHTSFLSTICLHPLRLPYCYCVGEATSTIQGWIEGAMETCDLVFDELCKDRIQQYCQHSKSILNYNPDYVFYDNWMINVKNWISRHPGGNNAISDYKQKDITQLFHFLDHSKQALNLLSGLRTHIQYKNKLVSIYQLFELSYHHVIE